MCLGNRRVELQLGVNLLLIAHHLKLEVLPKDHKLVINPFPTAAPGKKLKFRVAEVTNPIRVRRQSSAPLPEVPAWFMRCDSKSPGEGPARMIHQLWCLIGEIGCDTVWGHRVYCCPACKLLITNLLLRFHAPCHALC